VTGHAERREQVLWAPADGQTASQLSSILQIYSRGRAKQAKRKKCVRKQFFVSENRVSRFGALRATLRMRLHKLRSCPPAAVSSETISTILLTI
jgi:hypothetical protein